MRVSGVPTVSVVVPTFNRARLLAETLTAITTQSVPPHEVIVVDDGSTDDTSDVVSRFGAVCRYVRITNSGDLVARNVGVRSATGDLVAFCDSDDLWRPNFLEAMIRLWELRPEAKVAYCDFSTVRDSVWSTVTKFETAPAGFWDGLIPLSEGYGVFEHPIVERVIHFQPFFASCIVVQREFFTAAGGWDEGVGRTLGSDFATVLRLAEHTPFGVVSRPLAGIRKHAGNFSADVVKMQLGDSRVLEYALATRAWPDSVRRAAHASVRARRKNALDLSFDRREFAEVQRVFELLRAGPPQEWRVRLKARIAGLPRPLASAVATPLIVLRSIWQSMRSPSPDDSAAERARDLSSPARGERRV